MYTSNRLSFFHKFPALDIASIPGHPNHVAGRMLCGMPVFDGDPSSAIDHVEKFNAHTSKEKVVHQDVLMLLFFSSLYDHNSWLQNHKPRSISYIDKFIDGFLRNFQVCPALRIQEEGFIEHHQGPENLNDEWGDESSLCSHDEKNDF